MKSVLISIQPKWCELIANGKKTIEVRKTRPKIETPFKCYIYCTQSMTHLYRFSKETTETTGLEEFFTTQHNKTSLVPKGFWNGKVIGEFVCDRVQPFESEFVDDDCYEFVVSLDYDEDGDATGYIEWSNDSYFPYESTDFYKKVVLNTKS